MVRNKALIGKAIVGYLERTGYPELALHFVRDPLTRFNLSLEANHAQNLEVAFQSAQALNDAEVWRRLAKAALQQGISHFSMLSSSFGIGITLLSLNLLYR